MMRRRSRHPLYGLMAEFETPETLIAAARHVRDAGYTRMDAYSPYPVEGLADYRWAEGREAKNKPGQVTFDAIVRNRGDVETCGS